MSKGKKRQKVERAKADGKARMHKSGGKSKYAQKQDRARRGHFSPTSPFYMGPSK